MVKKYKTKKNMPKVGRGGNVGGHEIAPHMGRNFVSGWREG